MLEVNVSAVKHLHAQVPGCLRWRRCGGSYLHLPSPTTRDHASLLGDAPQTGPRGGGNRRRLARGDRCSTQLKCCLRRRITMHFTRSTSKRVQSAVLSV